MVYRAESKHYYSKC